MEEQTEEQTEEFMKAYILEINEGQRAREKYELKQFIKELYEVEQNNYGEII